MKTFIFKLSLSLVVFTAASVSPLLAANIYEWEDQKGLSHYTDNPSTIPKEYFANAKIVSTQRKSQNHPPEGKEKVYYDYELEVNETQEIEKKYEQQIVNKQFRKRALDLYAIEIAIIEELNLFSELSRNKKNEVDFLLIYGYQANASINELRYLEDRFVQLELRLDEIKPEFEVLREEARHAGVPPGYLRP